MTPKKIASFALGPIGGALISLITLPFITWHFSQEDVGRIGMLQITISFAILLFSLGLDQAYVRNYHDVQNKPALLRSSIVPSFTLLILILVIVLSIGLSLSSLLFGVSSAPLSGLIIVVLILTFISRFLSLVLRMKEQGVAYSMSQLLTKLLLFSVVVGIVLLEADTDIINLVAAYVLSSFFVFVLLIWNTKSELMLAYHSRINKSELRKMLKFGFPLIFGGLAFWGLTATDKIFLRSLSNFEELGLYSVSVSFAAAASILQAIFSTVWAPIVYKWVSTETNLDKVNKVTKYILAIVILFFILAGLLSWLISFFLPSNYKEVRWIVVSCLGYPLLYTLSETTVVGIGVTKRSSFSMLASIIAFIINVIGNWLLIPKYGAAGAASSTCFSFFIFFILRTELAIYVWKPIPRKLLYTLTSISVSAAIVFTLWGELIGIWSFLFWAFFLVVWIICFFEEIKQTSSFVYKRNRHSV